MAHPDDDLIARLRARLDSDPPPEPDDGSVYMVTGSRTIKLPFLRVPPEQRPPPRLPPCGPGDVDRVEEALGVRFPPLLRRIFTEVGEGGFGPGDGLLGLEAVRREHQSYAVDLAVEQELGEWPGGLVPLCQLDQTLLACIDCTEPSGPIVGFDVDEIDFDEGAGFEDAFSPRSPSLHAWLDGWLRTGDA